MSSSSKKGKKTKYRQVAVETILPNAIVRPVASWAEEVESELLNEYSIKKISAINLPTAPRAACDLVIDDSKIPPNGPFMAYLTNLPYEITEDDIAQQFKELKIANIRLPKDDRQDRMKGFGYVEFQDKSNLIAALQEGELQLKGRCVRISLPSDDEPSRDRGSRPSGMSFGRNRDSDRNDRSEKLLGEWRAGAPVPHDPEKSASSRHSVGFTRPQNRERDSGFRDFKSNFQPADSGSSFSRGFRDDRDGRSSDRGGNRMFKRFDHDDRTSRDDRRSRDREDRMGRSAFGKKFEREDRAIRRESKESDREEPKQRPRIEIQPRSIPLDANRTPESLPASIFGGAKPVDTARREMEMEAKLSMANATVRSRGPTPPAPTPTSNLSRSSSVSSISCNRKTDNEPMNTVSNATKSPRNAENESNEVASCSETGENRPKQPQNVWKQRSAALATVSDEKKAATTAPSSVMNNSEAVVDNSSNLPTSCSTAVVKSATEIEHGDKIEESSSKGNSRYEVKMDDPQRWTTYSQETFDNPQPGGALRFGNNRFSDKSTFSRDSLDNRRDRRENHREGDRKSYRALKNREVGNETTAFGRKWNHRDGGGAFKSRSSNDFGGPRRQERDHANGNYNSFRDRNESKPNDYRAFGSSHNSRNERDYSRHRRDDRKNRDERLIAGVQMQPEPADSRLKVNVDNTRPLENGNDNDHNDNNDNSNSSSSLGMADNAVDRGSSENIVNSGDQSEANDDAFRTRKKQKKKKKIIEEPERERKSMDSETKTRNFNDEKKNNDNYQNIDKAFSKTNVKGKGTSKVAKKSRGQRDDVSQMPKQKEDTPKDFQDKNRFEFLTNDDN